MAAALKWFFALLVIGCGNTENVAVVDAPPPYEARHPATQAELSLGTPTLQTDGSATLQFSLDDRYPLAGAKLQIHELWLSARIWLNDQDLGEVSGGSFPAVVELPDILRPGPQNLRIMVTAAAAKSGLLQGARRDHNPHRPSIGEVVLHLAPESHIEWMAFPSRDQRVVPRAAVHQAPEGASVEFAVYLDGRLVQDLGSAPVIRGIAQAEPLDWEGNWWSPKTGAEALYQFSATLRDSAQQQVDRHIRRGGVRDISYSAGRVTLNGEASTLLAVRMEESWKNDGTDLREFTDLGVNAIEIHGSYPPEEWLELTDESGLQVVLLPRCDGEVFARPEDVDTHQSQLRSQQDQLALETVHHPSILFWTTEGTPQLARRLAKSFEGDPLNRLVTGRDIPALSLSPRDAGRLRGRVKGSWITEITNLPGTGPELSIQLFKQAIAAGAIGGVLPVSRNQPAMREIWERGIVNLAEELQGARVAHKPRRSSARLQITGLKSRSPVWLVSDHTLPTGSIPTTRGSADLRLFHEGPVELHQGSTSKPLTLETSSRTGSTQRVEIRRLSWASD